MLDKLAGEWRVEAAEIIVLVNDASDYFARALLIATPACGRLQEPRYQPSSMQQRKLDSMAAERAYIHKRSSDALASYSRKALDLVALEAFARRLTATSPIVTWLEWHDGEALRAMK
jgi:hypothetical protein